MTYLEVTAPTAGLAADRERRTISGLVVPWDTYAPVSTGQRAAFAPGSLTLSPYAKMNLDHDPTKPVGVLVNSESTAEGMRASFRIPEGPAGDQALADAASGLRDGLSIGADVETSDDTEAGTYVTAARVRHVALLSEPAYEAARVTHVAAGRNGATMPTATDPTISWRVLRGFGAGIGPPSLDGCEGRARALAQEA